MEDFIGRKFTIPKEKYVTYSKLVALGWGGFTMFFGFFTGKIAATAIEAINKIGSVFYGPILGMFLLASFGRWVKPVGANIGVVVGVAVNVVLWLFFKNVFWFWWNAIGGITTLMVGITISVLLRESAGEMASVDAGAAAAEPRVFPWREITILVCFFVAILTFCILLPRIF
jgi:hypothetical protein